MKVEYRRDMQNSYLVLILENQENDKSYPLRMITENKIGGLLFCECKRLDNDILYYYDVTSQISLEDKCKEKKIRGQEILVLVNRFLQVLSKLEEFLLNANSICLLPQYIYIDSNLEIINFCYVPGESWKIEVQFRELLEYLLPYLDHQEQDSMLIGYGIYQYALREQFSIDGLYAQLELYQRLEKKDEQDDVLEESKEIETTLPKKKNEDIWNSFWDEDEEKESVENHMFITISAIIVVIWGAAGWFLWRNFLEYLWIWVISGIVLLILWIVLKLMELKKHRARENMGTEEQELVAQTELLVAQNPIVTYVFENENSKQQIILKNQEVQLIGRDESIVDIILPSKVISRVHGKIRIENNRCFLTDLNSKNGTRVNGIVLVNEQEIELLGGEKIQWADLNYSFRKYEGENDSVFLS